MKKFLKYLALGVAYIVVKDSIKRTLFDEGPTHFVFKVVPNSNSEKKFMEVFSRNSECFKNMRVQFAEAFGTEYNAYLFDMKPKDIHLLDGFIIEF